ncbi:hypothetical protein JVT61DRAFT_763 [Boletus reticuloceps]|uniref:G domain-containing protein n=1 Tax=Boletus reticuloceps TaxID=495285 RepID=A0A8I2Z0A3_9AGAM|nr:hypothetical protein JVT61DRAFT_763 [Boletus reticuloceps]
MHFPSQTNTRQQSQTDTGHRETTRGLRQVPGEPVTVNTEDLEPDDIVIAFWQEHVRTHCQWTRRSGIGHDLTSCTTDVRAIRFLDQESGRHIVLVDTPGFDDTYKSDLDILNMISNWLNSSYQRGKLLSGILYLHRISDNRMAGTPLKNLRLLQKLCGNDALRKVYLTTTMWDEVTQSIGDKRLEELKTEYWKSMLAQGAQAVCSQTGKNSARRIIQTIVSQHATRKPMLLQREMNDLQKQLTETQAGQELYAQLKQFVERHESDLKRIDRERKVTSEPSVLEELLRDYYTLRVQIDDASCQMQELRPSWFRRLFPHKAQTSMARRQTVQEPPQRFRTGTEYPGTAQGLPQASEEPPQTDTEHTETTSGLQVSEESFAIVNTEKLEPDDVVIAVMGPTGSGKSTFVRLASGHDIQGIGHELKSYTQDVLAIRSRDRESGRHIVLVDTPGFNDTHKSDLDILNIISEWLNSSYKQDKLLSGILYLHRISDNRMAGTPLQNLRVFEKLCGKDALNKVYLTTTMWDEIEQSTGEKRLEELETEYWKSMIIQGAQVVRSQNNEDSAKKIIQQILDQEAARQPVLLQKEMTDLQKQLKETQAGQELYSQLEQLVAQQMELLKRIDRERKLTSEANMLEELQREYSALRVQIDSILPQIQELRLSWLEHLFRLFSRRRE